MNQQYHYQKSFKSIDEMRLYGLEYHINLIAYKNVVYDVSTYYSHPGSFRCILNNDGLNMTNTLKMLHNNQNMQQILWKLNNFRFGYLDQYSHQNYIKLRKTKSEIQIIREYLLKDCNYNSSSLKILLPLSQDITPEGRIQLLPFFRAQKHLII